MAEQDNNKHNEFVKTVFNFVTDVERYHSNTGCVKLLTIFKDLDMNRVLIRFIRLMGKHELKLKNQDDALFEEPCEPLPGLHLSEIIPNLSTGQKRKVFNYLQYLLILAKIIVKQEKESQEKRMEQSGLIKTTDTSISTSQEDQKDQEGQEEPTEVPFNPFVGVGDSSTPYSVDELYSNMDCLQTEEKAGDGANSGFGLGSIGKMLGVDGMLNMDDLTSQLNNISDQDIDDASEKIQKMMGGGSDSTSSKMLSEMLSSIKTELNAEKSNDNKPVNPLMSIAKIAKTVADNLKPKMDAENINPKDIFNNLVPKGEDGVEGDGVVNPLNMLSKLMNSLPDMAEGKEDVDGEVSGSPMGNINPMGDINPMAMLSSLMGGGAPGGKGGNPMAMISQMMGAMNQSGGNSGGGNPMAMLAEMMGAMDQSVANSITGDTKKANKKGKKGKNNKKSK